MVLVGSHILGNLALGMSILSLWNRKNLVILGYLVSMASRYIVKTSVLR